MAFDSLKRRQMIRSTAGALSAGIAGCLNNSSPGKRTVDMTDGLVFEPATVTIARGGTVTWENVGSVDHTVTAYENGIPSQAAYFASGGFDSEQAARQQLSAGLIGAGGTYDHTFEVAGTYDYYCIPHESSGMVGTVRVK
jgi:plastocyanin